MHFRYSGASRSSEKLLVSTRNQVLLQQLLKPLTTHGTRHLTLGVDSGVRLVALSGVPRLRFLLFTTGVSMDQSVYVPQSFDVMERRPR